MIPRTVGLKPPLIHDAIKMFRAKQITWLLKKNKLLVRIGDPEDLLC